MQSVKINFPRDDTHIQTTVRTMTRRTTAAMPAMIHGVASQFAKLPCVSERYFQSPFPNRPIRLKFPPPPPPKLPLINAAKAIVSHFAMSKGRNNIAFIHSSAAWKGAMISILGAVPFMPRFHPFRSQISSWL